MNDTLPSLIISAEKKNLGIGMLPHDIILDKISPLVHMKDMHAFRTSCSLAKDMTQTLADNRKTYETNVYKEFANSLHQDVWMATGQPIHNSFPKFSKRHLKLKQDDSFGVVVDIKLPILNDKNTHVELCVWLSAIGDYCVVMPLEDMYSCMNDGRVKEVHDNISPCIRISLYKAAHTISMQLCQQYYGSQLEPGLPIDSEIKVYIKNHDLKRIMSCNDDAAAKTKTNRSKSLLWMANNINTKLSHCIKTFNEVCCHAVPYYFSPREEDVIHKQSIVLPSDLQILVDKKVKQILVKIETDKSLTITNVNSVISRNKEFKTYSVKRKKAWNLLLEACNQMHLCSYINHNTSYNCNELQHAKLIGIMVALRVKTKLVDAAIVIYDRGSISVDRLSLLDKDIQNGGVKHVGALPIHLIQDIISWSLIQLHRTAGKASILKRRSASISDVLTSPEDDFLFSWLKSHAMDTCLNWLAISKIICDSSSILDS